MQDARQVSDSPVLVVDLDGTLVQTDLLFECFWSALSQDPLGALGALTEGPKARAKIKRHMALKGPLDVTLLPYDADVLDEIGSWRSRGLRVVLVTASDQIVADQIAAHLAIFDEVHGSDGTHNLKGEAKAHFLTERYGKEGYIYIGDSKADLPVWRNAAQIITVNVSDRLRAQAEALGPKTRHLGDARLPIRDWLWALRPHQWVKNILVFIPVLVR